MKSFWTYLILVFATPTVFASSMNYMIPTDEQKLVADLVIEKALASGLVEPLYRADLERALIGPRLIFDSIDKVETYYGDSANHIVISFSTDGTYGFELKEKYSFDLEVYIWQGKIMQADIVNKKGAPIPEQNDVKVPLAKD